MAVFMFATMGQCYKTFYYCKLLPFYKFIAIIMFYDTGRQQYHGMAVNYHGKKFYNIGPRCQCYGTHPRCLWVMLKANN